jgi:uncharacterized protein YgiM (DUF1202 family)
MNCKIALLALIGLSFSTIACSRFQSQPSPLETGIVETPVTAVSEIALQACKTEIVRLVPQSQSFRVYDYQPQSDGTSLLLWRTSEKTAGFCKVDQDGKVLQLSTDEESVATTPTTPSPTTTTKPTTAQSTAKPRSAVLTTKTPGSQVNIRSQPTTDAGSAGYGLDDDRVQVLDETEGKDGFTWYLVKFESGTEGWVRGDLVELANSTASNSGTSAPATALNACKRRAAQEFQTSEAEVDIAKSQVTGGISIVSVRSSSGTTADCQVNQEGNVIAWVVRQQMGEDPATMCDPKKGPC